MSGLVPSELGNLVLLDNLDLSKYKGLLKPKLLISFLIFPYSSIRQEAIR